MKAPRQSEQGGIGGGIRIHEVVMTDIIIIEGLIT